ncbi:hypothetical protein [endosymbiont GvMRE of Glomus versiforme]|uniref:hypothetical protein n=1 Tax=endosymbiont GvMRE of Glomus versiforme TaxID=2039283 RepID=UPI000EE277E5|nr:hypothetical protein [endosymbiont GvMRE of Glomus versiforme]RHZ36887.1 hypothetical protein GvMRE_I2g336 [endosymbiont GvMRE of Glomus versiforme]
MSIKWNCNKCNREILSKKKDDFCLECGWKQQVEKTEITPETIRSFMEKYWFAGLTFQKGEYFDLIHIEAKNKESFFSYQYYPAGLTTQYHPRTKRNIKRSFSSEGTYNEYTAFLEKLFHFAEREKIKRIRGNWRKEVSDMLVSFKVDDIIIEKKTVEEIEKEEV